MKNLATDIEREERSLARLTGKQIQAEARAVLAAHPEGLRWAEVLKAITTAHPETPSNTIRGATHQLFHSADDIVKIARGTYQLARYVDADAADGLDTRGDRQRRHRC